MFSVSKNKSQKLGLMNKVIYDVRKVTKSPSHPPYVVILGINNNLGAYLFFIYAYDAFVQSFILKTQNIYETL